MKKAQIELGFKLWPQELKNLVGRQIRWAMEDPTSVTRLGDFLNLLATNFLTKVAQIFYCFLGNSQKCHF